MEQTPGMSSPNGLATGSEDKRRLKSVANQIAEKNEKKRTEHDRFAELGNVAAVFAHEVGNPLYGLSASLQFALKDLASLARGGLAGQEPGVSVVQEDSARCLE